MAPPWGFGYGPGETGGRVGGGHSPPAMNCCLSWPEPTAYVSIGGSIADMDCDEVRVFTIDDYNPACEESHYKWFYTPETGTLVATPPYCATYTAPPAGLDCVSPVRISLECDGEEVDAIIIAIKLEPVTASIGYTTLQMAIDEEQTLNVVPGTSGCGTPVYDWAITAGGGTLSASSGDSVVYTAPHTNPSCSLNPTIALTCNGVELDTLKIAVNADGAVPYAGQVFTGIDITCQPYTGDTCWCTRRCPVFRCDGSVQTNGMCGAGLQGAVLLCTASYPPRVCNSGCSPVLTTLDSRTTAMKQAGCCPAQLL